MQLVMSCFPFCSAKCAALVYPENKYLLFPLLYSVDKCQNVILIKYCFPSVERNHFFWRPLTNFKWLLKDFKWPMRMIKQTPQSLSSRIF